MTKVECIADQIGSILGCTVWLSTAEYNATENLVTSMKMSAETTC